MSSLGNFSQAKVGRESEPRTRHEDKTNEERPTSAKKEDATNSTATTVTATTISHYEVENRLKKIVRRTSKEVEP